MVQLAKEEEKERERRIFEDKDTVEYKERMKTYDRLVGVQEDLLRTMRKMQVDDIATYGATCTLCLIIMCSIG